MMMSLKVYMMMSMILFGWYSLVWGEGPMISEFIHEEMDYHGGVIMDYH